MNIRRVVLIGVIGIGIWAQTALSSDPIATVNGIPISREAFQYTLETKFGHDVLSDMISDALISQAIDRHNLVISESAVEAEIAQVRSQFATQEEFAQALVRYKLTLETFRRQIGFRMALEQLGAPDIPTEAQLADFFEANKSQYDSQEEVNVRHILVQTQEEAQAILKQLKAGANFGALAKEKSLDPGSKDKGGEIGFYKKGQLVPEFEAVAFTLKPGVTSELVKTNYGYHIIQVIEHRMPQTAVYASVKNKVLTDYRKANTREPQDVLNELRSQAEIVIADAAYKALGNEVKVGNGKED